MIMTVQKPSSRAIPIVPCMDRLRERQEEKQEETMADFKDYLFYSRIVDGIQRKQEKTRSLHCRYQNQALIDHLTVIRNSPETSTFTDALSWKDEKDVLQAVSHTLALVNENDFNIAIEDDDALICDMEI